METEIEKLQAVLQNDPSNFQARRELSILLANEGFNEEALSNLKYLEKYFPKDAEIQYNLGILYEELKDLDNAKISYEKAIEISPQNDFYYNLGEVLVSLENWDYAIESFKKVIETESSDGNCYFNLGLCYYNKEESKLAIDNFQKAIELNPNDIYAYFYLGCLYQNEGLTNFAEENYKKVLNISPDYSWAYYNLAAIAFKNNNIDNAKNYLLKTIEFNNYDIEAYKLLAKIFIKQEEVEEAISFFETRLNKEENGDLFYILSQIYKHVGYKDEYIKNLQNAVKNNLTLSYPIEILKQELSINNSKEDLPIENILEYSEDDDEIEENDDLDDDLDENIDDIDEDEYENVDEN